MTETHVLVLTTDVGFAEALKQLFAAQMPLGVTDSMDPSWVRAKPDAAAVIVDARADTASGRDLARLLRGMGYVGGVVVIADDDTPPRDGESRWAFANVKPAELPLSLIPKLAEQMLATEAPYSDQVMRARRIVAAGEIALRLQHAINNPLAGLLAETQLLQLEELPAEFAPTLERMVGLCRRMVELTRSLDGIGERRTPIG